MPEARGGVKLMVGRVLGQTAVPGQQQRLLAFFHRLKNRTHANMRHEQRTFRQPATILVVRHQPRPRCMAGLILALANLKEDLPARISGSPFVDGTD